MGSSMSTLSVACVALSAAAVFLLVRRQRAAAHAAAVKAWRESVPPLPRTPARLARGDASVEAELRACVAQPGTQVLMPSVAGTGAQHEAYKRARGHRLWNRDTLGCPSVICLPSSVAEVARIVAFAAKHQRTHDVRLAVSCGKHSAQSMIDDSLLVDLSQLAHVNIDPKTRIVRVGGGALLGDVDRACAPHGLAVPTGHCPSTGVGGLTLNGGHGYLERACGLSVDNIVEYEVVTVRGEVLRVTSADDDAHRDLFWALRGGGGNFGIVTEFVFRAFVVPEGGQLYGGARVHLPFGGIGRLLLPSRDELLRHYASYALDAPNEFGSALVFTDFAVIELGVWFGARADGRAFFERHVHPFGRPVVDEPRATAATGVDYWKNIQSSIQGPDGLNTAPRFYYMKSQIIENVNEEFLRVCAEQSARVPNDECAMILVLGGGKAGVPSDDASAVYGRRGKIWLLIQGSWGKYMANPSDAELARARAVVVEWVRSTYAAFEPLATGAYAMMPTQESEVHLATHIAAQLKSTGTATKKLTMFGDNLPRLRTIKTKYDPNNVFLYNHNIAPLPAADEQ